MPGYTGSILRINLTKGAVSTVPTAAYEHWGGGHGMGSALFFDLVEDKTISGFDPRNVVTIMTSPLSGTLTPGCSSRTEVQGIGVQAYPVEWFTRSNFGGRFSSMLKYAGWDGIVIEGASTEPVWIDIRDNDVQIRKCDQLSLWGKDTWECQQVIWDYVSSGTGFEDWMDPGSANGAKTTQRPAVLAIGPAGENLSRMACLIHDAANGSGQGGFGAVWGAKKLKAVSVIGTGSITIHDPNGLLEARIKQVRNGYDYDNPAEAVSPNLFQSPPGGGVTWESFPKFTAPGGKRPQACIGCHSGCRRRYESGLGNEASCAETTFYLAADTRDTLYKATDLLNKLGINILEAYFALQYLKTLYEAEILGPGRALDCPLNFDEFGTLGFIEQYLRMVAYRNDGLGNESNFGNDIAEGTLRAAEKWGRLDEGLSTGELQYPYWGYPFHYDPRTQLEWGYGSILGDRDINEHCFVRLYSYSKPDYYGGLPQLTTKEVVSIITSKMVPFQDDQQMIDYSTENMYSKHMARLVAWHRHYNRFWKQSMLFCDNRWPDFINPKSPDMTGSTGEAEPLFLNAVTGKNFTFLDGMELGRKIWNLDQAIWTLQGRHRDMVHFADYVYTLPKSTKGKTYLARENGELRFIDIIERHVDRQKFEEFKTSFYELEGWDPLTGYPTRSTLEGLDLGYVADELAVQGKLGSD